MRGLRLPLEEVTAEVAEIVRKLEVEPEDVIKLLQSHDKTLRRSFFLWMFIALILGPKLLSKYFWKEGMKSLHLLSRFFFSVS